MKALDMNQNEVTVRLTEDKPHIFLNGEEVSYSSLDYGERNRIDGKIDDLYEIPTFDGAFIRIGHPEIGWCVKQSAALSVEIHRENYADLRAAALRPAATNEDLMNLGRWFESYGETYWNGEYYDADGARLFPIIEWDEETEQGATVGYELR